MRLTEKQARDIGDCVLKQLPEGWKATIWENIGWHVSWVNGAMSLHYSEYPGKQNRKFWAIAGEIGSQTGHGDLTCRPNQMFRNPRQALREACKQAKKAIRTIWQPIIRSVNSIEKSLAEKK